MTALLLPTYTFYIEPNAIHFRTEQNTNISSHLIHFSC